MVEGSAPSASARGVCQRAAKRAVRRAPRVFFGTVDFSINYNAKRLLLRLNTRSQESETLALGARCGTQLGSLPPRRAYPTPE